jgi:putative acetyltransferase
LITYGLGILREKGVELVMTYGDPKFYSKVGFAPIALESIRPPFKLGHPEGWLGQSQVGDSVEPIAGHSTCVKALNRPEYW